MNKTVEKYFSEKSIMKADVFFTSIIILLILMMIWPGITISSVVFYSSIIFFIWIPIRSARVSDSEIDMLAKKVPEDWEEIYDARKTKNIGFFVIDDTAHVRIGSDNRLRSCKYCMIRFTMNGENADIKWVLRNILTGETEERTVRVEYGTEYFIEEKTHRTECGDRRYELLNIAPDIVFPIDTRDSTIDVLLSKMTKREEQ